MQEAKQTQLLSSLRSIDRISEETKALAANTNTMAYQNGQKLQRIEGKLKGMNGQLIKAQDTAKEITSFWYYLKKKVKAAFGIKKHYPSNTAQTVTKLEIKRSSYQQQEVEVKQDVSQEDAIMDSILSNLSQLKRYGKDFSDEMDRQKKIIQRVDPQMDKAITKMSKVNKILKKQLGN